jgi:hypothetical protein
VNEEEEREEEEEDVGNLRQSCFPYCKPFLTIRVLILMLFLGSLGLGTEPNMDPDPHLDPLVTSTDPATDPSIIAQNSKKNLDFKCFVSSF